MSNNPGATKPLPAEDGKKLEDTLNHLVEHSKPKPGQTDISDDKGVDALHTTPEAGRSWISRFWPSSEHLESVSLRSTTVPDGELSVGCID